ncbi:MAG: CheY-like chemotaxis protein [Sulfitobacter sp.]|jgi:CheY-like chemotaxis protein
MEASMDSIDPFTAAIPAPTAARPLLGLTVLVVEDSRFACEALRLLCLHSGARIRRADCLRSARRHLRVYRPSVIIVDLGLPDGSGLDLIAELAESQPGIGGILAMSGDPELEPMAMTAGAHGFMAKPVVALAPFQEKILSLLPFDQRPMGPRAVDHTAVEPDRIAYRDDIAHVADILEDTPNGHALDYVAQFLTGVAGAAGDARLEAAAKALARERAMGRSATADTARIAGLIQSRLSDRLAI